MNPLDGFGHGADTSRASQTRSPASLASPSAISSQAFANLTAQSISRPASSQRSTPGLIGASKTPVNDSFSGLLSLNSGKGTTHVTLQERQRQLIDERRRQIDEQHARQQSDLSHLDALSGAKTNDKVGDILAAFNPSPYKITTGNSPVATTHPLSRGHTPIALPDNASSTITTHGTSFDEDDDPFGLGPMGTKPRSTNAPSHTAHTVDNDDILGDLGKPVQAKVPMNGSPAAKTSNSSAPDAREASVDPGLAELMDMGFSADRSRQALDATSHDVQAAVGWLLNKAHEESGSRPKLPADEGRRGRSPRNRRSISKGRRRSSAQDDAVPAWMRPRSRSAQTKRKNSGSANKEKDVAQFASEFGTAFFKSANTLWKQGQKKVQKAVAEFQLEGDGNQPKWMREVPVTDAPANTSEFQHRDKPRQQATSSNVTNEAMLLESDNARPIKQTTAHSPSSSAAMSKPGKPSPDRPLPERTAPDPRFRSPRANNAPSTSRPRKFDDDAEAASVYVSSARRRRPPTQSPAPQVDLFSAPAVAIRSSSAPKPTTQPPSSTRAPPVSAPRAPLRDIPALAAAERQRSHQYRKTGAESYKRGDYAAAHESFTAALTPLPSSHPIAIVVLCNHAMTALKIGDAKEAISSADRALAVIGPSKGDGETIDLGDGEAPKSMKEFYGKALTRKAEALEHTEQWSEAATCWQLCIEAGFGGAVSAQGRDRCQQTARAVSGSNPSTGTLAPRKPPIAAAAAAGAQTRTASSPASSAAADAAVRALRAQTAQAERTDDEKFALADTVDARIAAWKGGKADNLRGLLASLDTVLWESAQWKKCSMAELVLVPRVKVIYMKAIAKVHPDKVIPPLSLLWV